MGGLIAISLAGLETVEELGNATRQKEDGIPFVYMDLFAVNIKIAFLKERVFREKKKSASYCQIH